MTGAILPAPTSWAALVDAVRGAQPGMHIVHVSVLRNLAGGRRADRAQPIITEALRARAVAFLPDPLPVRADALVALFMRGTEIGDLVWVVSQLSRGEQLTRGMAGSLTEFGRERTNEAALEELDRVLVELDKLGHRARAAAERLKNPRRH